MPPEPGRVTIGERRGGESVGEDRDADGDQRGRQQQVFVREFARLLDDQDHEDDGGEPARPNQPRKAMVGPRACRPTRESATGTIRTTVRLSAA